MSTEEIRAIAMQIVKQEIRAHEVRNSWVGLIIFTVSALLGAIGVLLLWKF